MTTPHIVVLPGGAYARHTPYEAEPVAEWLRGIGVNSSVFRYPLEARHPEPLRAVIAEVARIRATGVTRVGLLGFSAGAHAAGLAALQSDSGVDAAILCYPVVSMQLDTHASSRHNLLGSEATDDVRASTSLDQLVGPAAPPFFIWHTGADEKVPVEHSYLLGQSLARNHVPHALHVFPNGLHGIGFAKGEGAAARWVELCAEWLREIGWIE